MFDPMQEDPRPSGQSQDPYPVRTKRMMADIWSGRCVSPLVPTGWCALNHWLVPRRAVYGDHHQEEIGDEGTA
jgi:hypothetical protein